jgi:glutathione S-transferase
MKLYDAMTPNTLRVQVFLAEKGIDVPREPVDLMAGGGRTPAFLAINPLGEVPVLELDDGTILTESVAICRYLESLHPDPSLFGADRLAQARIEMWNRRMELHFFDAMGGVARHSLPFFADTVDQIPAYAESQLRRFDRVCGWLDEAMADDRPYVAGDAFSVADITGMATLLGMDFCEKRIDPRFARLKRWEAAMRARPSFAGLFAAAA